MRRVACFASAAWLACSAASAAVVPQPGPGDPRIHFAPYDPNEVVVLKAALGYQTVVEFEPGEHIENVAVGDALGWQITPNRRADLLFVKPLQPGPVTNMTVITNLRRYSFELSVRKGTVRADDPTLLYTLRFQYPPPIVAAVEAPPPPPPPPPPQDVNHAYSYQGPPALVPARVFDDGRMTYFKFPDGQDYPAIFVRDAGGSEAIVNSFSRDGFVVVDRLAPAFVLRRGKDALTLINDAYAAAGPDAQAPRARPAKKNWFSR